MKTAEAPVLDDTRIDDDDLMHVFCKPCKTRARSRAKKPVPFCGKTKEGPWLDDDTGQICQMCVLIARENPCTACGLRSRV